ncbi:Uncharacterized protein HZ326_31908 [Fusarium oxysporum f. sp. albedinis]|nr:Uncharacterized protein HZ326_31908 [Fusarium oxysporum f. sp. albedinis]
MVWFDPPYQTIPDHSDHWMVAGLLVIKFLLPECCGRGNSIFMPFLWPVLLDIRDAFTGIKEESGGVYGNLVS